MKMTKNAVRVAAVMLAAAASPSYAATLFDNGPIVNGSGLSLLSSPATTYGAGANPTATVADNFTVAGAGWNVSSIDFYGYQTQTGTGVFTFTGATWSVRQGTDINTSVLVASGTTAVTNGGLVGYRTLDTDLTNQNRAIFRVSADVTDFSLGAGNYFLTWSLAGTGASGPFVPPIKLGSGNALQSLGGAAYTPLVDSGSLQNFDLPFTINGTFVSGAVPEPASWAMMILGMGAVGFTLRRRAKVATTVSFAG
jgi:hypothetical protein